MGKTTKQRGEAKGRTCQIRLGGCQHDYGVVGCHYPLTGHTGVAMKAPDLFIAWGCFNCHQIVDGVKKSMFESREDIEIDFLRGVLRTQAILAQEGKLVYCDKPREFDA